MKVRPEILAAWLLLPATALGRSPLQPALLDAESYTETITAIADLDDGTYVQAQLAVSNIGIGDGKGACRLLVIPAAGDPWTDATQVDDDGWRFSEDPVPQLMVGTCQIMAARSFVVDFQLGDASLHIDMAARARSVAPPGSFIGDPEEDFYTYELLIPWAPARARVTLPGKEPIVSDGRGYADHSRSTMMPADLARSWVRFRGLGGTCPTLLLVRTPPEGKSEGWIWSSRDSEPRPVTPKVELPTSAGALVVLTTGNNRTLRITPTKRLYRHAPLEEYALAGLARRWIGSPETTTFRATLAGAECGAVAGILEITEVSR